MMATNSLRWATNFGLRIGTEIFLASLSNPYGFLKMLASFRALGLGRSS